MILARYIGLKSFGNFTPGKVYLATPGFAGSGAVDMECFIVDDESGKRHTIQSDKGLFQFLDEVYAVVLKPVAAFERGEVVTIVDADDEFFEVKGKGYFKASQFELLDHTNVVPGNYVLDAVSQRWMKINRVTDQLLVSVENDIMRPITDFQFPVGNDGVQTEPFFKCINTQGLEDELTEGRMYRAESVDSARGLLFVSNNQGNVKSYMMSRFDTEK